MSGSEAAAIKERAARQLATMGAQSAWLGRVLRDVEEASALDPALVLRRKLERASRPALMAAIAGGRR